MEVFIFLKKFAFGNFHCCEKFFTLKSWNIYGHCMDIFRGENGNNLWPSDVATFMLLSEGFHRPFSSSSTTILSRFFDDLLTQKKNTSKSENLHKNKNRSTENCKKKLSEKLPKNKHQQETKTWLKFFKLFAIRSVCCFFFFILNRLIFNFIFILFEFGIFLESILVHSDDWTLVKEYLAGDGDA